MNKSKNTDYYDINLCTSESDEQKSREKIQSRYQDILLYFMDKYNNTSLNSKKEKDRRFVSESKINIVGVCQYSPFNVSEVTKFRNFINK